MTLLHTIITVITVGYKKYTLVNIIRGSSGRV